MRSEVIAGYTSLAHRHIKRFAKAARHLPTEIKGKRLLRDLVARTAVQPGVLMSEKTGWVQFDLRNEPEMNEECQALSRLAKQWRNGDPGRRSGVFPISLLHTSDLKEHPWILEFALRDRFLLPASVYLGQVPRLSHVNVLWSPQNATVAGSQKFHYDHRDTRQAKIFVNLGEVDEDCGPLCFLPADCSARFNARVGYTQGRIEDEAVYSACAQDEIVKCVGDPATGFMIDTARCLHYGSRGNVKDRLILMINYVRPNCVNLGSAPFFL